MSLGNLLGVAVDGADIQALLQDAPVQVLLGPDQVVVGIGDEFIVGQGEGHMFDGRL